MDFTPEKISQYAINHSNKEHQLLSDLNRETWANVMNPRMLSGFTQGRFLSMISNMISPQNILEIGTYTGYSALCLAEGLKKGGMLHTLDINEEYAIIAKKYFDKSMYKNNITQYIGNALDIISELNQCFELAFIDADKENYCKYFDLIIDKIKINGYIIADNVLWSGKVLEEVQDKETQALNEYNKKVLKDERIETLLLPIRDGLMISKKIRD
tara:strand:+ start:5122 stop:5763 length:642 start_codon:yes stop_codon:yes gene_type:complete